MDRFYFEGPHLVVPDKDTEDQKLIAQTGDLHEQAVLEELRSSGIKLVEISRANPESARSDTMAAFASLVPIIYQALLEDERFSGFSDFLILDSSGQYQIWDTKLARSPKPYFAIQLCCYAEMYAKMSGQNLPKKFGIILGTKDKVEFNIEDYIHYYRRIRDNFLAMQDGFSGNLDDCPEPLPRADHGRWTSLAEKFFEEKDHLINVAGISVGQIKKLTTAGITTLTNLATYSGAAVNKLAFESLEKLIGQARLQHVTRLDRSVNPIASARYETLASKGHELVGLAALPIDHPADVFFDMEGYPLIPGGLEYLFGACIRAKDNETFVFNDWWAHDRGEEKLAFEGFVDWVYQRWRSNPGMHIYHYAAYEVSAVRRLSTQRNSRQQEVDELLTHEVFVDLYKIVQQGLRIGEDSYSLKKVERLYRAPRLTGVATAADSIVQYARWIESKQPKSWNESSILKNIRAYNEDDCISTAELLAWLRRVARENGIAASHSPKALASAAAYAPKELTPDVVARLEIEKKLRTLGSPIAVILSDLIEFHRREEKPIWWRMFDRAAATPDELRDDSGCIEGISAVGSPVVDKQSLVQTYQFDSSQECKLAAGEKSKVMFSHNLEPKLTLTQLDVVSGELKLKLSKKALGEKFGGAFPDHGSLLGYEYVSASST